MMRVENLMIGDWVIDEYTNRPMRIEVVNKMMGSGLSPISITAEILEKNGFKKDEENDSIFIYKEGEMKSNFFVWVAILFGVGKGGKAIDIDVISNNNIDSHSFSSRVHKVFVHELQHELRLEGLNDLANNFKI